MSQQRRSVGCPPPQQESDVVAKPDTAAGLFKVMLGGGEGEEEAGGSGQAGRSCWGQAGLLRSVSPSGHSVVLSILWALPLLPPHTRHAGSLQRRCSAHRPRRPPSLSRYMQAVSSGPLPPPFSPHLPVCMQAVSSGVEAVFSSPAAISAAFGRTDGVGIDVQLLDTVQLSILDLYACE